MNEANRCAIYARFSSEKQNRLTIDQQIRKCREYADRHGLLVLDDHIYADEAISGATDDRAGLQRLLSEAQRKAKPFDAILVDDTSRLSRKLADSLRIFEQLQFARVRVVFVAQGIDTTSEQAEVLVATHGIVDSLYLKDLAKRTFRGVEQKALGGFHTGGRVFGYRGVPIESKTERDSHGRPVIEAVRLEVDQEQASTVRRIFERYAAGHSLKRIAVDLNDEGVESPQPQKGRVSRSWCPSSVRHILHNERYRGMVVWGKTHKIRSPKTGKRIYERQPQNQWRRTQIPEQRIVSDRLWNRVRERMGIVEKLYGVNGMARMRGGRAAASPHLFTGLLSCAHCGGSITIVSGGFKWKNRSGEERTRDDRYGCSYHASRGDAVCTNNLLIGRQILEAQLLTEIQNRVLHPDVVAYTLKRFEEELRRSTQHPTNQGTELRRQESNLERRIANVARSLADGYSSALRIQLAEFESGLAEIRRKLATLPAAVVEIQIRNTRRFVESRLADLRPVLNGDPAVARAEVAKHVQKITLTADGKVYVASGTWDLLGFGSYDGAGGQNRTGYARLFRAALYQ